MGTRDWMQIKTELDELRPGDHDLQRAPATAESAPPMQTRETEDSILTHIADALRQESVE